MPKHMVAAVLHGLLKEEGVSPHILVLAVVIAWDPAGRECCAWRHCIW